MSGQGKTKGSKPHGGDSSKKYYNGHQPKKTIKTSPPNTGTSIQQPPTKKD